MQKPVKKPWKAYGRYGSVGIELILSMAAGFVVGRWGDGRLGTAPWLSLLGFVVGVYAGFRQLFRTAAKMTAEAEREDAAASGPEPTETWREPAPPEDRRDGR